MKSLLSLVLFISLIPYATSAENDCVSVKAAFDVGSGSTKVKVVRVDTCNDNEIIEELESAKRKVKYADSLKIPPKNEFNSDIIKKGQTALSELYNLVKEHQPDEIHAVATAAFRKSKNSQEIIDYAKNELNLDIKIISQQEEAKLGYYSVVSLKEFEVGEFVVWDIGGGSMQITYCEDHTNCVFYFGELASSSLKNFMIRKQGNNPKKVLTPNPMSAEDVSQARWKAFKTADSNRNLKIIKRKIQEKNLTVVGIGGVHEYLKVRKSDRTDAGFKYLLTDPTVSLYNLRDKTDDELGGGDFANVVVTNLALISGYMSALDLNEVNVRDMNLTSGMIYTSSQN